MTDIVFSAAPPSTVSSWPVTNAAAGDANHATALGDVLGADELALGHRRHPGVDDVLRHATRIPELAVMPGSTTLHVIPSATFSAATVLASPSRPAFVVL